MEDYDPGFLFDERFQIIRHLGVGGTGTVYLAEDSIRKERVIIKILHDDVIEDAGGGGMERLKHCAELVL